MTINIDVLRRSERAWLIKRDYGVVTFVVENVDMQIVDFCVLYRKRNEESGLKIDSHEQYLAEIADEDQDPLWVRGKPRERALAFDKTLPPNKA